MPTHDAFRASCNMGGGLSVAKCQVGTATPAKLTMEAEMNEIWPPSPFSLYRSTFLCKKKNIALFRSLYYKAKSKGSYNGYFK